MAYFAKGGVSPFVLTTQVLEHKDWNSGGSGDAPKATLR